MVSSATRPTARPGQPRRRPRANFFSLPGELRNKIYRLSLVKDQAIALDTNQIERFQRGEPALLRCNVKVKQECERIYFEENTFCFTNESLTDVGISTFRQAMGNTYKNLKEIKVQRSYRIGDMRPITIRFRVFTYEITERSKKRTKIAIERPQNENLPFPGIRSKMRGKLQEPCRCEVDVIAKSWQLPNESSGFMLFEFLNEYIERISTLARHAEISVCKKCNSVRRT